MTNVAAAGVLPGGIQALLGNPGLPADAKGTAVGIVRKATPKTEGQLNIKAVVGGTGDAMMGLIGGGAALGAQLVLDPGNMLAAARGSFELGVNAEGTPKVQKFLDTITANREVLGTIASNIDPKDFADQDAALGLISNLKRDEFLFGSVNQTGAQLLYKGSLKNSPQALVDIVKGASVAFK